MNEQELRIGNLISYKGEITELLAISKSGLCNVAKFKHYQDQLEMDINDFDAIELTHDILIKSGYQYANENGQKFYWHIDLPYFQLRQDDDIEWLFWHCEDSEHLITKVGMKYFHQLQNTHKILSGEDITLKQ